MTEDEALKRMVAPGTPRAGKYRNGVVQIWLTRACDKACFGCTQASNIGPLPEWGNPDKKGYGYMTPAQFEIAVRSLKTYWGVIGLFGGNPAMSPHFEDICGILEKEIPFEQRGLWCNNPITADKAKLMRKVFNPRVSNLNVHLDQKAHQLFKQHWPESIVVGLHQDSRHSPPYVAMKDVLPDEGKRWELISNCDINQHWSTMIGVFRGQVRAWFCEIAGAQAMLHQHEPDYPDTGLSINPSQHGYCVGPQFNEYSLREGLPAGHKQINHWWQLPMQSFRNQVRKHCHDCGVPLRGHGELAQSTNDSSHEQVSTIHQAVYNPKRTNRRVELVTVPSQLGKPLESVIKYLQNSSK